MIDVTETVDLDLGLVIDGVCHSTATLRPARLADSYAAAGAVVVPDGIGAGTAAGIAYQMAVDDAQVLAQVAKLGSLDPAPPLAVLIAEIDPDDMALLRDAAVRLKKKLRQSRAGLRPSDVPNASSSMPDSA